MLDLFDILDRTSVEILTASVRRLTGNIEVEDIVFASSIIDQLPARFIHDQDFPLRGVPSVPWTAGSMARTHLVASGIANRIEDYYDSKAVSKAQQTRITTECGGLLSRWTLIMEVLILADRQPTQQETEAVLYEANRRGRINRGEKTLHSIERAGGRELRHGRYQQVDPPQAPRLVLPGR